MRFQNVWGETRAQMELQSIEVRRGRKKKCLFGFFLGAVLCKTVLRALSRLPSVLNQRHGAQPRLPICSTSAQFACLSEKEKKKKRKRNIKTAVSGCSVSRRRGRGAAASGTGEMTLLGAPWRSVLKDWWEFSSHERSLPGGSHVGVKSSPVTPERGQENTAPRNLKPPRVLSLGLYFLFPPHLPTIKVTITSIINYGLMAGEELDRN